jgi:hypothetical protein
MGTRSVVAVQQDDSFKGRYIHWDGYPSGVGEQLLAIIKRDGVERAREVLLGEHYGWSNLDFTQKDGPLRFGLDDGRFTAVQGYGVAYTTFKGQSSVDDWITNDGDDWGTEWAYILRDDEIVVLERVYPDDGDAHATGWFGVSHDNDKVDWAVRTRTPYTADSLAVDA